MSLGTCPRHLSVRTLHHLCIASSFAWSTYRCRMDWKRAGYNDEAVQNDPHMSIKQSGNGWIIKTPVSNIYNVLSYQSKGIIPCPYMPLILNIAILWPRRCVNSFFLAFFSHSDMGMMFVMSPLYYYESQPFDGFLLLKSHPKHHRETSRIAARRARSLQPLLLPWPSPKLPGASQVLPWSRLPWGEGVPVSLGPWL